MTTNAACTRWLLGKLPENIKWAQMKIKPSKSRSISIAKGKLKNVKFCIGDDPIPTVSEQPVKSLGRWYDASLSDKDQVQQIRQDITNNLETSTRPYCQESSSSGACNLDFSPTMSDLHQPLRQRGP